MTRAHFHITEFYYFGKKCSNMATALRADEQAHIKCVHVRKCGYTKYALVRVISSTKETAGEFYLLRRHIHIIEALPLSVITKSVSSTHTQRTV